MKSAFILFAAALLAVVCDARLAEKVSEDDDFVVYRIPVKSLDLETQATGHYEGVDFNLPSHGRSSSKSSSTSKSSSSSTGSGKGRGYGKGGSSTGHGQGYGGSSSGHGYGSSGQGYGGGSGGQGYGEGSGGQGYGGGSSDHGYGGSGYGGGSSGHGYGGGSGHYRGSPSNYSPGGYEGGSNTQHYDGDEHDHPKIVTTTKSFTTKSAHDTGVGHNYRQAADSVGETNYRLGDYLKDAPGHEHSHRFSPKIYEGFGTAELNPAYRSGQGFNVNEFTRTLNHGFQGPTYRNNRFVQQASFVYPKAYTLRNVGFGLGGF